MEDKARSMRYIETTFRYIEDFETISNTRSAARVSALPTRRNQKRPAQGRRGGGKRISTSLIAIYQPYIYCPITALINRSMGTPGMVNIIPGFAVVADG